MNSRSPTVQNEDVPANAASVVESPFFISVATEQIFAFLHEPQGLNADTAVIVCHASAEEKYWSHRVYVNFAREAARSGKAALRIDFRGEGESDGEFESSGIRSRVDDVRVAVAALVQMRPGLRSIVLMGHRLGAMVAGLAAAELGSRISGLVLWDAVFDGRGYLMQVLRQHLAMQLSAGVTISADRESLLDSMLSGERVNIEGYEFGNPLVSDMVDFAWHADARIWQRPALIVDVSSLAKPAVSPRSRQIADLHGEVTATAVKEAQFWRETRQFHRRAPSMMAATAEWLAEKFP